MSIFDSEEDKKPENPFASPKTADESKDHQPQEKQDLEELSLDELDDKFFESLDKFESPEELDDEFFEKLTAESSTEFDTSSEPEVHNPFGDPGSVYESGETLTVDEADSGELQETDSLAIENTVPGEVTFSSFSSAGSNGNPRQTAEIINPFASQESQEDPELAAIDIRQDPEQEQWLDADSNPEAADELKMDEELEPVIDEEAEPEVEPEFEQAQEQELTPADELESDYETEVGTEDTAEDNTEPQQESLDPEAFGFTERVMEEELVPPTLYESVELVRKDANNPAADLPEDADDYPQPNSPRRGIGTLLLGSGLALSVLLGGWNLLQQSELNTELQELSQKVANLQGSTSQPEQASAGIDSLRDQITSLEQQIQSLTAQSERQPADTQGNTNDLQARLDALENNTQQSISSLESQLKEALQAASASKASVPAVSGDWTIHVIVSSSSDKIFRLQREVNKLGMNAQISQLESGSRMLYSLKVPGYASQNTAKTDASKIENALKIPNLVVKKDTD